MSELKIIHDSWELNKVFTISRSSKKTAETVEVQITKNGKTGFGEGVPYSHYDESIESVTSQILPSPNQLGTGFSHRIFTEFIFSPRCESL